MSGEIAIAFVGSVVPDRPRYHNEAFSRAINQWQENLIYALRHAGLTDIEVFSAECVPRFPRSNRLIVWGGKDTLEGGVAVSLLPFLNLGVCKVVTPGLFAFVRLLRWGYRKRHKRRLVLSMNLMIPPCIPTLWAAKLIGAKTMASANDIFVPGDLKPDTLLWRANWWIHKRYLPRFDGLNVVNPLIVTDLAPAARFIHVDTGVREEFLGLFEEPGETSADIASDSNAPFTIAFAGWLSEMNMVSTVLEAFSQLREEGYRLEIAGSGEMEELVRHAAEGDQRIVYHGYLPFDDVVALYRRSDLLLNLVQRDFRTTRYSFPGKLAQLLATGKPVMTTYTQNLADITFVLPEPNAPSLAEALRSVRTTPRNRLAEMGRAAREYVRKNKTWEVHGRTFRAFIESLFEP